MADTTQAPSAANPAGVNAQDYREVLTRFGARIEALGAGSWSALHSIPAEAPIDYLAAFAQDVPRRSARHE